MGPRFESVKVHQRKEWPVGQVVKTEASHAFNIGSNPVRVTTKKADGFVRWFPIESGSAGRVQKALDKAEER